MKKLNLLTQILIAFVLAVIFGGVFGPSIQVVQPLGDLFLNLIKFLVAPLILSTLVVGVASTGDVGKLGRMGGKTIAYYLVTTFIAVSIGLVVAFLFSPGTGLDISATGEKPEQAETGSVVQILLNIVPTNPFAALAEGNVLQIIFFAIFLGLGITIVGEKAQPVFAFFNGLADIMYKITGIVMKVAPIGIFGLLAPIIGQYGLDVILPLMKVIIAVVVACVLQVVLVYSIAVKTLGKMSPLKFFKGVAPAGLVAFTTSSSSGTLPITMRNVEENLGVSKKTSSFVLPLGATINMDGTSIYQGVAALFIAQFYGIELSFAQILMIVITATLASIGTAGVPGAGMVMLTMVLSAVRLPLEGVALVAGIDRILDMFRTCVNVLGDTSAAVVVDESEKRKETTTVSDASLSSSV